MLYDIEREVTWSPFTSIEKVAKLYGISEVFNIPDTGSRFSGLSIEREDTVQHCSILPRRGARHCCSLSLRKARGRCRRSRRSLWLHC